MLWRIARFGHGGVAVLAALLLSGCGGGEDGPELIEVDGTVTMDGEPVPDAMVRFVPVRKNTEGAEYARPAIGRTDEDGEYTLEYSSSRTGAIPGEYLVSITTFSEADVDEAGNDVPGSPETIPDVYNVNTTLTAEIKPDGGPYNFELSSSAGEVIAQRRGEEFGSDDVDE